MDFTITKALQSVVEKNKLIKEVHFDQNGNYFFNKHEVEVHDVDDFGQSKGTRKVVACPGAKKAAVKVPLMINGRKVIKDKYVITEVNPVAASFTREEVLSAKGVSNPLSDKQKLEILNQAAEIAQDEKFMATLDSIRNKNKK